MLPIIRQKFFHLIVTLIGVTLFSFFLIRMAPGDPVLLLLGERGADPVVYQEMKKNLGLDKPPLVQYGLFMKNAIQGDLGKSIVSKRKVTDEFWSRFPATLELGICVMIVAIFLGIPLGVYAAYRRNSIWDYTLMGGSLTGYSMPLFWWALILILIFSVNLGWTPVSGRLSVMYDIEPVTGFYLIDSLLPETMEEEGIAVFWSVLHHLILPTFAMATIPLAIIARMTRSSMLEVLGQDFIRTAKAKGASTFQIIFKHALRNALIPIMTIAGLLFGSIITGAVLTETIFSWPGIGKWLVASVNARDYPVIQGGVLFIASFIVIINATVDLLYYWANPKLKKGH
jgi:dipeptide transport system permease protein